MMIPRTERSRVTYFAQLQSMVGFCVMTCNLSLPIADKDFGKRKSPKMSSPLRRRMSFMHNAALKMSLQAQTHNLAMHFLSLCSTQANFALSKGIMCHRCYEESSLVQLNYFDLKARGSLSHRNDNLEIG